MRVLLTGRAGMKIRACDGCEEQGYREIMSTPLFYLAKPGDRLTLLDDRYRFNVATYSLEIEPRWIYTYDYAPDESWTVYRHDLNGESYRQGEYIFSETVYFRVCLRKNAGIFDGTEDINDIINFDASVTDAVKTKPWIKEEARRAAGRVEKLRKPGTLAFALLTDSHYVVNGTWDDTAQSIKCAHEILGFDGIIHLGDMTDGMVTAEATRLYVRKTLDNLRTTGVPVYVALGNHDSNYFRDNPERFSEEEQCELYLGREKPRYYVECDTGKLRMIFLDSFDPCERLKYGYSRECVSWLAETLKNTCGGRHVLLFSHLPPAASLQYWTKELRGEDELMGVLRTNGDKILAWVNGHNHADMVYGGFTFPVISIANAKCEAFIEHKAAGFITPERKIGDASQECWDILLVNTDEKSLDFVRFGAGSDRGVTTWDERNR